MTLGQREGREGKGGRRGTDDVDEYRDRYKLLTTDHVVRFDLEVVLSFTECPIPYSVFCHLHCVLSYTDCPIIYSVLSPTSPFSLRVSSAKLFTNTHSMMSPLSTMTALRVRASVTCQHITLSALNTTYDSLESTSQCHLSTHHTVSTQYNI